MKPIIDSPRSSLLKYDIRALAVVAGRLKAMGANVWAYENIGDPIAQGHQVPSWIKEIFKQAAEDNANWGYAPSEGLALAREFVAREESAAGCPLDKDDVVFTSGLGHGINTLYQVMSGSGTRTIQAAPAYPAHSSSESFFSNSPAIYFKCDPEKNWQPDLEDLENKIKQDPKIGFILLIVPNNPTGVCYGDDVLKAIADLARKYRLGIISDETYIRLVYSGQKQTGLAKIMLAGEPFPLVVMKSASKDIPWPGGRAGWLEFFNPGQDKNFSDFQETIKQALRVEVGSTTMVQAVLPQIYGDARYPAHLKNFIAQLEEQSSYISRELNSVADLSCVPGQGAFYLSAVFKAGSLKPKQTLPIENLQTKNYIESLVKDPGLPLDKRFAFYLMASKGIFLTPLTSFAGPDGFRVTTLKTDLAETKKVYASLKAAVREYLES